MSEGEVAAPPATQVVVAGEGVLLTLWVGGLWAIGYLAVPILFAGLDDRALAGMLAGRMFTAVSFIGIGCGSFLLARLLYTRRGAQRYDARFWLLTVMLALTLVGEFALQPLMAQLKAQGLAPGTPAAGRFAWLHGFASILYLVNSICGLALLVLWRGRRAADSVLR